jgi:hypothetical protein
MSRQNGEYDDLFRQTDLIPPEPLGLLPCLMVEIEPEWWGCFICKRKQSAGSYKVWVSLDVKPGDSTESVIAACVPESAQAGWCVECARKLGRSR